MNTSTYDVAIIGGGPAGSTAAALRSQTDHAYQVTRGDFEKVLVDHAVECGAEIREETSVNEVVFTDNEVALFWKAVRADEVGTPRCGVRSAQRADPTNQGRSSGALHHRRQWAHVGSGQAIQN